MLELLLRVVQGLAVLVVMSYLFVTFQSALRMAKVHDRYAHIEFNDSKWRRYGRWAPKRLRWLGHLRNWAVISALVGVAATFGKAFAL